MDILENINQDLQLITQGNSKSVLFMKIYENIYTFFRFDRDSIDELSRTILMQSPNIKTFHFVCVCFKWCVKKEREYKKTYEITNALKKYWVYCLASFLSQSQSVDLPLNVWLKLGDRLSP